MANLNEPSSMLEIIDAINGKQEKLVSGTNIKTINNESLLGSGNINISGGGGTATDVQINGTSITSNNVANIKTNSTYNATSNKIATMSDVPSVDSALSSTSTNPVQNKVINSALSGKYDASNPNGYTSNVGTVTKVNNTSPDANGNVTISIPTVPLEGVQINGSDLTITNKKVNIPLSGTDTLGVAKANAAYGVYNNNGNLTISRATDTQVTQKTSLYRPLTPSNIDLAVKLGVTTNGIPLTDAEKVHAKDWLGIRESGGITDVMVNDTSITSNNVANIVTNSAYNSSTNKIATMNDVFSRNIGEIVQSTIPLSDAGLHLLDGSLLQYGSYKAFIDYIASIYSSNANYFCTESEWQTSVTTYGVCGKFVYNSTNNTVRLPKITGFTESTIDVTTLGNLTEAGLPNITGHIYYKTSTNSHSLLSGAFQLVTYNTGVTPSGTNKDENVAADFNASASNSIYGNSTTVQPQSIKVLYYIVVANTTKTDIEIDIDEVVTDLNGKADNDLGNLASTSSTNFDGQIIFKYVELLNGTPSAMDTSTNLKTTGYLPNDNYKYEVFVRADLRTNTTAVQGGVGNYPSPWDGQVTGFSKEFRVGEYSRFDYHNGWLPLNDDGIIYYQTTAKPNIGITIALIGYRRTGTNS